MEQNHYSKILEKMDERITQLEAFEKVHLQLHAEMMLQLKPITETFSNVNGFGKVTINILKGLVLIGAGLGVIYALVEFLRNKP